MNFRFDLIDNDAESVRYADRLFAEEPGVSIISADLVAEKDLRCLVCRPPHIVTLLGGLNSQVLRRSDAFTVAPRCMTFLHLED